MRISKAFRADQELITRFLNALGSGSVAISNSKLARPGFFVFACGFIKDYIEDGFFKKEKVIIKVLEEAGFPMDEGPVAALLSDHVKCNEASEFLLKASKQWQSGDEDARMDVAWAASQYTGAMRQNLDRLKNLIFPLLEQTLTPEDEHKVAEGLNQVAFAASDSHETEKFLKMLATLEDELSDWR
jgi:hemerythrin-like domain-containing protein